MVAPTAVPLVENEPGLSRVWTWHDKMSSHESDRLADALRREKFDAAVMLYYQSGLAKLLFRVGIKKRYGPLSKWSSWILLNRGSRQNRSAGRQHEARYNLDLVQRMLNREGGVDQWPDEQGPQLKLSATQKRAAVEFRQRHQTGNQCIVFIHPGSGGSALDWEPDHFAAVANELASDSAHRVFITGAGADAEVIGRMRPRLSSKVSVLLDAFPLRDFLPVLAAADLLIGPSTGPLHMASALGVPTLGLFPPAPTMNPERWGPQRADCLTPKNMVPDVSCPARRACRGSRCEFYNCLDKISIDSVLQGARELIAIERTARFSPVEDMS